VILALVFFTPAGAMMFSASVDVSLAVGLRLDALRYGWNAFHFWR
jgi:hypothetical protein